MLVAFRAETSLQVYIMFGPDNNFYILWSTTSFNHLLWSSPPCAVILMLMLQDTMYDIRFSLSVTSLHAGFYVNHFVKDLGIALEECKQMGLGLPGLALVSFTIHLCAR